MTFKDVAKYLVVGLTFPFVLIGYIVIAVIEALEYK